MKRTILLALSCAVSSSAYAGSGGQNGLHLNGLAPGVAAMSAMSPALESRIEVRGTALVVVLADGREVTGQALVGAQLAHRENGQVSSLRIDAVDSYPGEPGLPVYRLSVPTADGSREDICMPDIRGFRYALFQPGQWDGQGNYDPSAPGYSLTCTSGAAGKCVLWGYKPWEQTADGQPMLPYYQSCTRMVRADYCGDGRGFTRDGTRIDTFDPLGINTPETEQAMPFEAAWGPQGALCVAKPRLPQVNTLAAIAAACPAKRFVETQAQCTEARALAPGTFILNRSE
ncbi:MAG: ADYC domain-containing protein [Moraxellaceae bacterium]|nr:ADYC domain-containing protein [Moraxellaceae bacterium]